MSTTSAKTVFTLGIEPPSLQPAEGGMVAAATVHAVPTGPDAPQRTACGRTLQDLTLRGDLAWPPKGRGRGLARCVTCDHAVTAHLQAGEPLVETVRVTWLREPDMLDGRAGWCNVGPARYRGTPGATVTQTHEPSERDTDRGELAELPRAHAEVLATAGYVRIGGPAGPGPEGPGEPEGEDTEAA